MRVLNIWVPIEGGEFLEVLSDCNYTKHGFDLLKSLIFLFLKMMSSNMRQRVF
jgi:hypothetical protein